MELIGLRDCSRRLGVSDTAVRKAIAAGRITVEGTTATSNRPLVGWPLAKEQWLANTNESRRTHIGAAAVVASHKPPELRPRTVTAPIAGSKPKKETPKADPPPNRKAPPPRTEAPRETPPDILPTPASAPPPPEPASGPTYAQSRAIREAYQARLAKLEYEEKSGRLVPADQVKADAFKAARSLRDALLNISGRIAHQLAHEKDPARISARIDDEIRDVLRDVAGGQL